MGDDEDDRSAPGQYGSLYQWFFRSRETGKITVAQFPNWPLWVFVGASVGRRIVERSEPMATILGWVALGTLLVWGADELVRGVNPWRRVLGATVLIWQVAEVMPSS